MLANLCCQYHDIISIRLLQKGIHKLNTIAKKQLHFLHYDQF